MILCKQQAIGNSRTILVTRTFLLLFSFFFRPQIRRRKRHEKNAVLSRFVKIGSRSSHKGGQNRATDGHEVKIRLRRNSTNTVTDPSLRCNLQVFFVTAQAHFQNLKSIFFRPCRPPQPKQRR